MEHPLAMDWFLRVALGFLTAPAQCHALAPIASGLCPGAVSVPTSRDEAGPHAMTSIT